jgi:hypothetical protein
MNVKRGKMIKNNINHQGTKTPSRHEIQGLKDREFLASLVPWCLGGEDHVYKQGGE